MLDLEAQKHIVDGKLRCWIDIDINDSRAAYQRAVDFVAAKNLAYNLSSNWLPELGGSELKRVKETLYVNDFEWGSKGRCAVKMPPQRVYVEVWPEVAPLAVENFVALLLGNRGKGQESGCARCRTRAVISTVSSPALSRRAAISSRIMAAAASAYFPARSRASRTTQRR